MHFKSYRFQLWLRIFLLAASIYAVAYLNFNPSYRGTSSGLLLFILSQIWLLVRFHNSTNRQFLRFLNSIKYDDFTELFHIGGEGKTQRELSLKLNAVMEKFREVRAEKEANLHYFEVIVQHIGTGIITYKTDGSTLLVNNTARKLLQLGQVNNITELNDISPELVLGLQQLEHGNKVLVPIRSGREQAILSIEVI